MNQPRRHRTAPLLWIVSDEVADDAGIARIAHVEDLESRVEVGHVDVPVIWCQAFQTLLLMLL